MREIKFKFWSKKYEEMYDWETVIKSTTNLAEWFNSEEIVPLQYAGFKDEEGHRIYEGHIVEDVVSGTVGSVRYSEKGTHFYLAHPKLARHTLGALKKLLILGTVFENPELLKADL